MHLPKKGFLQSESIFLISQIIPLIKFIIIITISPAVALRRLSSSGSGAEKPTVAKSNRPKQQHSFHHSFDHRDRGSSIVRQQWQLWDLSLI